MEDLTQVGWVPVNDDGTPVKPLASNRYMRRKGQPEYIEKPSRIYTTEGRAAAQSPAKKTAPVFISMPDNLH